MHTRLIILHHAYTKRTSSSGCGCRGVVASRAEARANSKTDTLPLHLWLCTHNSSRLKATLCFEVAGLQLNGQLVAYFRNESAIAHVLGSQDFQLRGFLTHSMSRGAAHGAQAPSGRRHTPRTCPAAWLSSLENDTSRFTLASGLGIVDANSITRARDSNAFWRVLSGLVPNNDCSGRGGRLSGKGILSAFISLS